MSELAPSARSHRASQFPLFDTLRAIAALSVFAYHVRLYATPPDVLRPYIARLDVGVTLFFLISGFLLYRPFARSRRHGEPPPNTGAYAWRRALRILPAYWVALTLIGLWLGTMTVFGSSAPIYYGLGQIYWPSKVLGGIGQAWSLCVELAFYVFLPLWAWGMRRFSARSEQDWLRTELIGLAVLFAVAWVYKQWVILPNVTSDLDVRAAQYALPRYLDLFALGMFLAVLSVWLERRALPAWLRPLDRWPALSWGVAGVAFWAVSTQIGLAGAVKLSGAQIMQRHYLFALTAFGLILPAVVGNQRRGWTRRIMASRALLWVGLVSYAVYLWQLAVLDKLADWHVTTDVAREAAGARYFAVAAVGLAAVLAIAAASWYVVERPALKLKTLLPRRGHIAPEDALRLGGSIAAVSGLALGLLAIADGGDAPVRAGFVAAAVVVLALAAPAIVRRAGTASRVRWGIVAGVGAAAAVIAFGTLVFPSAPPAAGDSPPQLAPRTYVAATAGPAGARLFVDGKPVASRSGAGRLDRAAGTLEIGGSLGRDIWKGRIDELAIYARPLGMGTIEQRYRVGLAAGARPPYRAQVLDTPGLVGYWRLGERSASAPARDAAGRRDGVPSPGIGRGAPGLISGDTNAAASFDGRHGSFAIRGIPADALRSGVTVEAWATAAPGGPRAVATLPGLFALGTDRRGHWTFSIRRGGAVAVVASPRPAVPHEIRRRVPAASTAGALLIAALGMVAAGLLTLYLVERPGAGRGPRRRARPGHGSIGAQGT